MRFAIAKHSFKGAWLAGWAVRVHIGCLHSYVVLQEGMETVQMSQAKGRARKHEKAKPSIYIENWKLLLRDIVRITRRGRRNPVNLFGAWQVLACSCPLSSVG